MNHHHHRYSQECYEHNYSLKLCDCAAKVNYLINQLLSERNIWNIKCQHATSSNTINVQYAPWSSNSYTSNEEESYTLLKTNREKAYFIFHHQHIVYT
jgi:hypothetical protein